LDGEGRLKNEKATLNKQSPPLGLWKIIPDTAQDRLVLAWSFLICLTESDIGAEVSRGLCDPDPFLKHNSALICD
jgi:hypothetical protein